MIVAALALIVALGGTAVALPGKNRIDKNDLRKNVVKPRNLVKGAVTLPKLRNGAVGRAKVRNGAVNSLKIQDGGVGPGDLSATALAPRAYALVVADGDVDEERSRGIADANVSIENDRYCFNNLQFTPKHVQATLQWLGATGDVVIQATINPPSDTLACTGAEDASVRMQDASSGTDQTSPDFFIAFFE
jgi:hypothetical protein